MADSMQQPGDTAPWRLRLRSAFRAVTITMLTVGGVLASYLFIAQLVARGSVLIDDLRYGRPRSAHVVGFVGHHEERGMPTRIFAMNLDRRIAIWELPGGDPARIRYIEGPYLVGADEHLTPVQVLLADVDGDRTLDLLVDIRRERIVYLNRDGAFRMATDEDYLRIQEHVP
jgi:hypothetical protein